MPSITNLNEMMRGWFVGPFKPTALHSDDVEVALKHYCAGDHEPRHHHRIATEVTMVVNGRVRMNGREHGHGAIIVIAPGESTDFEAITDVMTVVVKTPAVPGDKYEDQPRQEQASC